MTPCITHQPDHPVDPGAELVEVAHGQPHRLDHAGDGLLESGEIGVEEAAVELEVLRRLDRVGVSGMAHGRDPAAIVTIDPHDRVEDRPNAEPVGHDLVGHRVQQEGAVGEAHLDDRALGSEVAVLGRVEGAHGHRPGAVLDEREERSGPGGESLRRRRELGRDPPEQDLGERAQPVVITEMIGHVLEDGSGIHETSR